MNSVFWADERDICFALKGSEMEKGERERERWTEHTARGTEKDIGERTGKQRDRESKKHGSAISVLRP